jgi:diguanylate cyclase (GGDEF)-like protein
MDRGPKIDLRAFDDSRIVRQVREPSRWLRFPADLEQQFQRFLLRRIRSRVRVVFGILPLVGLFQWLDARLTGGNSTPSFELVPNLLFIIIGNFVVWSRWYQRVYLPGATVLAAVFLTAASFFMPLMPGPVRLQVLVFVINTPIVTYLLLGLPFHRATAINAICVLVYSIAASRTGMPAADLLSCISGAALATTMAAVLAYTAERATRTQFLQELLLAEIASRDGLTGLQNRATFDGHLNQLWSHAQRTGESLALLLFDVDHFKSYNDSLGHQAGDGCLRQVAGIIKDHARRPFDLAARFGGEEFAIILCGSSLEQARQVGEAVRAAVEALAITNPAATRGIVTVSCGAAALKPQVGRSPQGLVQLADEALYLAKEDGRNCLRVADIERYNAFTSTSAFLPPCRLHAVK